MAFILVTGGGGFIGSHVVRSLVSAGHRVRVLDVRPSSQGQHETVEFMSGSTGDPNALEAAFRGIDRCIHLAGTTVLPDPRAHVAELIDPFMAASNLLFSAAARASAPVVFASSAAVYGETADLPIAETAALHPRTAHGLEKLALETSAARHAKDSGLPSLALRMFNVYGPGQSSASPYCGVVRLFAEKLLTGKTATVFGDGTHARDFVYIDDIAAFVAQVVDRPLAGASAVNLCSGRATTILELIDALQRVTGRTLQTDFISDPETEVTSSVGDPRRAETDYGFRAGMPLDAGVRRLIEGLTDA